MSQLAVLMFEHPDQARDLARDCDGQAVHTRAAKNCRSTVCQSSNHPCWWRQAGAQEAPREPDCGLRGWDRVLVSRCGSEAERPSGADRVHAVFRRR